MKTLLNELWGPSGLILVAALLGMVAAFWSSVLQSASSRESMEKSERIAALQGELLEAVTGGKSFCWFVAPAVNSQHGIDLMLIHNGDYPVYDIKATIKDSRNEAKEFTYESVMASRIHIECPISYPGYSAKTIRLKAASSEGVTIGIDFVARNGIMDATYIFAA